MHVSYMDDVGDLRGLHSTDGLPTCHILASMLLSIT